MPSIFLIKYSTRRNRVCNPDIRPCLHDIAAFPAAFSTVFFRSLPQPFLGVPDRRRGDGCCWALIPSLSSFVDDFWDLVVFGKKRYGNVGAPRVLRRRLMVYRDSSNLVRVFEVLSDFHGGFKPLQELGGGVFRLEVGRCGCCSIGDTHVLQVAAAGFKSSIHSTIRESASSPRPITKPPTPQRPHLIRLLVPHLHPPEDLLRPILRNINILPRRPYL